MVLGSGVDSKMMLEQVTWQSLDVSHKDRVEDGVVWAFWGRREQRVQWTVGTDRYILDAFYN